MSASSIAAENSECLNGISKAFNLLLLNEFISLLTVVSNADIDFDVLLVSKVKLTLRIKFRISGSTITGVIEATVYFFKLDTRDFFSLSDRTLPELVFTEINTLPYSGSSVAPVLVLKEPVSPLNT